jgi:hypothetical protein
MPVAEGAVMPAAGEAADDDAGLALLRLVPQISFAASQISIALEADDLEEAGRKQACMRALIEELSKSSVCVGCWVETPSAAACHLGVETWIHAPGKKMKVLCSHCTKRAVMDGSLKHHQGGLDSLRRRAYAEAEMALELVPCDVWPSKGRLDLKRQTNALKPRLGHGGGMKRGDKVLHKGWLVGQLYRSCERLALEPLLRQQREALRLALKLLVSL